MFIWWGLPKRRFRVCFRRDWFGANASFLPGLFKLSRYQQVPRRGRPDCVKKAVTGSGNFSFLKTTRLEACV